MSQSDDQSSTHWHIEKRVRIELILAIAVQTLALGYWIGGLDNRITNVEQNYQKHDAQNIDTRVLVLEASARRLDRLPEEVASMKAILLRMEERLNDEVDRRRNEQERRQSPWNGGGSVQ